MDLQDKQTRLDQNIIEEEKSVKDDFKLELLKRERSAIEERKEKARSDLRLIEATREKIFGQRAMRIAEKLQSQRLKNIEDITTLITLALFSLCIVFMIFVDISWNYSVFNYSTLSKLFFSLALLVLLIRVYLRSKEL